MKAVEFGYDVCSQCRKVFKKERADSKFCCDLCKEQFKCINLENIKHIEKSRFIIFERDEFKCVYCGRSSIEHGCVLCIDHIDPYSLRMNNNIYNLITSCYDCNSMKGRRELSWSVYQRIIEVNKKRTDNKISKDSRSFVSTVMDIYFKAQKEKKKYREYI